MSNYSNSIGSTSYNKDTAVSSCSFASNGSTALVFGNPFSSIWSSISSHFANRPEVNIQFANTSTSNGVKIVQKGNPVTLVAFRQGGDWSQPLTVGYTLTGTAVLGTDYWAPINGSTGWGTLVIPAGQGSVTQIINTASFNEWTPQKSITATVNPSPIWYTIGDNNSDTVNLIDNRVRIRSVNINFRIRMTTNLGNWDLGDTTTHNSPESEVLISWAREQALSAVTSAVVREFTRRFIRRAIDAGLPSAWVMPFLGHLGTVETHSAEITVTYDINGQAGPPINISNGHTGNHSLALTNHTVSDFVLDTPAGAGVQNGVIYNIVAVSQTASESLWQSAMGILQGRYPGRGIILN